MCQTAMILPTYLLYLTLWGLVCSAAAAASPAAAAAAAAAASPAAAAAAGPCGWEAAYSPGCHRRQGSCSCSLCQYVPAGKQADKMIGLSSSRGSRGSRGSTPSPHNIWGRTVTETARVPATPGAVSKGTAHWLASLAVPLPPPHTHLPECEGHPAWGTAQLCAADPVMFAVRNIVLPACARCVAYGTCTTAHMSYQICSVGHAQHTCRIVCRLRGYYGESR
jgi:hypothetical protein